jgi:hypothetical protein
VEVKMLPLVSEVRREVRSQETAAARRLQTYIELIRMCSLKSGVELATRRAILAFVVLEPPPKSRSETTSEAEAAFSSFSPKERMVTGRMRKLAVQNYSTTYGDQSSARWVLDVQDITTDKKLGHIAFDSDPVNLTTRHIFCLLCNAPEKYREWQLTCLGLAPTDDTLEVYKRIGLIIVTETD